MKNAKLTIVAMLLLFASLSSCVKYDKELSEMKGEIITEIRENVIPFWIKYAPSPDGGFYGMVSRTGVPFEAADRGGVLNSRILWSFAAAYNCFGDSEYLNYANRSQKYYLDSFIDSDNGGVIWLIKPDGSISSGDKYTYALTYGIYGLVEHYKATGSEESLSMAKELFNTLESKGRDAVNDGYIESFTSDWQRLPSYEHNATKTLNAHLHVLEAYTELYKVWRDEAVRNRLEWVFSQFRDVFYDSQRHHFKMFFNDEWESTFESDSYGHEVETGWLMCAAAESLGDKKLIKQARTIAVDVTRACLEEAFDERGYLASSKRGDQLSGHISWWMEIEAIIACVNAYNISSDEFFKEKALTIWDFIKNKVIDREYGEWFSDCMNGEPFTRSPKINMWRCPYHTVRLAVEMNKMIK